MGKRGPRPEPEALRILHGTAGKRPRPLMPAEVEGQMSKPEWLGPVASAKWDEMVPILEARKTVSPAYVDFLAAYCQAHQDMHDAMAILERDGPLVETRTGTYAHPAVAMKARAIERIAKFGREFGLSPTSIRDVQASPNAVADKSKSRFFA